MTETTAPHASDDLEPTGNSEPKQRYDLPVPKTWPHLNGPLHGLLDFQMGKCAVCFANVDWNDEPSTEGIACNSMRQWVQDDLLLGLVCYRCARRYKTLNLPPDGAAVDGLPAFLKDPPGQRCAATAGLGRQSRPKYFDSRLRPTEVPSAQTWAYANTVIHSLFLWQRGRCAICSTGLSVATQPRYVHVDHDDTSGLIRGLLCQRCNICLGQDWPRSWWEHHAPTVEAYVESPPAQICPATKGLSMSQRNRPAALAWSADRQEILLDGMPMSIAPPVASDKPESRWYAVRYEASAPTGLPPALEASLCIRYSDVDDGGDWLAFLMNPPAGAVRRERACILRLRFADVADVSEHQSLEAALAALRPAS